MTKTYDNEMKIEFLSKSKNEAFARIAVAAFIAQLDPTVEEVADIKTAVSEAVTNAIIHGYEEKIGIVKLICGLTVVVETAFKVKDALAVLNQSPLLAVKLPSASYKAYT